MDRETLGVLAEDLGWKPFLLALAVPGPTKTPDVRYWERRGSKGCHTYVLTDL